MDLLKVWCVILALYFAPVDSDKKVSVQEIVLDSSVLDVQWLGEDFKTVLLQTDKGRVYRSGNRGESWSDTTDQLKLGVAATEAGSSTQFQVDSMQKSPADPNVILVRGVGKTHFVSMDAGSSWRKVRQRSTIHTWIFHKARPKWALLSTWTDACGKTAAADGQAEGPCNHNLYVTKDLGKTFVLVASYVVQFSWGDLAHNQQDRIYFTHFRETTGDQPKLSLWSQNVDFACSDDLGKTVTKLVHRGNKFLVSHNFLFVAKLKDKSNQNVNLMTSSDGGLTFRLAKLPQELDEKSYAILDTSEGIVMLHVNHGSVAPFSTGNVYVSDKDGTRFSLSLPNNVRGTGGDCEFDKVLSLDGVYIANVKDLHRVDDSDSDGEATAEGDGIEEENAAGTEVDRRRTVQGKAKEESVVRTVISFDKGGLWSYLKPPTVDSLGKPLDCPVDKCWLHLHGITNFHNYAPFYSIENAVGIIMGTGNIGPYLRFEPDEVNTYLSRDGGLTWFESHKGAFIYEFGDHGGLVLMADDVKRTKQVVFSWNEGISWYDFEFADRPMNVDNIVIEPNATTTSFLVYGTRGTAGVLYHLDFQPLGQPLCKGIWAADSVSSDYETWTPTDGRSSDSCILGRQITYTRRKASSECFNGEKLERPVVKSNCVCTEENFDCEVGFSRKIGSVDCRLVEEIMVKSPETCTSSDFYHVQAYRKVVGDTCEGGWQPEEIAVPCPASSKMGRGAMSILGVVAMIAILMGAVAVLSKSDNFKKWIANHGFESFKNVKYAGIGANMPETALESVGSRYDADFLEGDQDDFVEDAPQLMTYVGSHQNRGDRKRDEARMISGGFHSADAPVPKLLAPPGRATKDDDSLDLL